MLVMLCPTGVSDVMAHSECGQGTAAARHGPCGAAVSRGAKSSGRWLGCGKSHLNLQRYKLASVASSLFALSSSPSLMIQVGPGLVMQVVDVASVVAPNNSIDNSSGTSNIVDCRSLGQSITDHEHQHWLMAVLFSLKL